MSFMPEPTVFQGEKPATPRPTSRKIYIKPPKDLIKEIEQIINIHHLPEFSITLESGNKLTIKTPEYNEEAMIQFETMLGEYNITWEKLYVREEDEREEAEGTTV